DLPGPGSSAGETVAGRAAGPPGKGLHAMLLPELQRMAQALGITGTGRMRKSQLVEAIQGAQRGAGKDSAGSRDAAAADNSVQRGASAGAGAPRHREQDAMEPDRLSQPGPGEGSRAVATAPAGESQGATAGAAAQRRAAMAADGAAPAGAEG